MQRGLSFGLRGVDTRMCAECYGVETAHLLLFMIGVHNNINSISGDTVEVLGVILLKFSICFKFLLVWPTRQMVFASVLEKGLACGAR